jgi:protein-S-isoprenylcysteine O-methyltransferase Ste14
VTIVLEFPPFTVWSLWIILVFIVAYSIAGMAIGDKLREEKIEHEEDHANPKTAILSTLPLVALLALCIFTPIVTGALFWVGCLLLLLAGVIYALSIAAFVKSRRGLTTAGIYRLSRNPMYVSILLILAGFTLMAWSASLLMGILFAATFLWDAATTHWMVLGEEKFLEGKYGATYLSYKRTTPRYLLF